MVDDKSKSGEYSIEYENWLEWAGKESLLILESFLKIKPLKPPIDEILISDKVNIWGVRFELIEGLKKNKQEFKGKFLIPACFQLSDKINSLKNDFLFFKIKPKSKKRNWNRVELNNIAVTVGHEYCIEESIDVLSIQIGIIEPE